jgi:hypothetical protein
MSACDDGVYRTARPAERPRLSLPILSGRNQEPVVHSHAFPSVLMRVENMKRQRARAREWVPALDPARFTAGMIGLYEAVLSEPVPESMLRLIKEIEKQEQKS